MPVVYLFEEEVKSNAQLKNGCSYFSSYVRALNYTNRLIKREMDKSIHDTTWMLDDDEKIHQEIEQILSSLELDAKERYQTFQAIEKVLQERRNRQKKDKIGFTKKYLKHNSQGLPIQFSNYKQLHQEYFTASPPEKKLLKSRHSSKAPLEQASKSPETKAKTKLSPAEEKEQKQVSPLVDEVKAQAPQFSYAWRVAEWFLENPSHLQKKTYVSLSEKEKFKQVIYHAFSPEVENYILSHGRETVYLNQMTQHSDTLYCIAGEIHFGNIVERGIYSFCVGQDGELYHRHFTKKTDELMYQFAQNIFYEVDYPPLNKSVSKKPATKPLVAPLTRKVIIDELTGAATLFDARDSSIKYVLFQSN